MTHTKSHFEVVTDLTAKHTRQLELMQQVSQVIGAGESVEAILRTTLHHLLHTLHYQAAQIFWLSPSGKDLWLYLEEGSGTKPVAPTTDIFSVDEANIIGHAIRQGEPIYLANILEGPYSYYPTQLGEPATALKSELAIPFKYEQGFLGVLRIQSNEVDGFDTIDLTFLSSLTSLLASVIKNIEVLNQIRSDLQEIKTLYNLELREDLTEQLQAIGRKSASGYEYNKFKLSPTVALPIFAQLALAKEQVGVSMTQGHAHKELVAPIKLYGETIGVIGLEDNIHPGEWQPEDISFLEEISSQVALAIENAHLLQQTQERSQELSLLFESSRQLAETIQLPQVYQILTQRLMDYLEADICRVLLIDPTKTYIEVVASQYHHKIDQMSTASEEWAERLKDSAYFRQLSAHLQPIIHHLADSGLDSSSHHLVERRLNGQKLQTLVTFPLLVRNRLVGAIEVGHLQQQRNYAKNELELAQAIITRASIAIENAQLFQQTQTALSEIQKLYDISRSLAECTDLNEVFGVVIENVKAYQIDRVSISLVERDATGTIEGVIIAASWDRESDTILPVGAKITSETFSLVHAFAQPPFHPLISEDLSRADEQDERLDEAFRIFMHEGLGAITLFSAPMFLGTEYKGVLSISTRSAHTYTKEETRIYQTVSEQAIIAIENHRLLAATQQNLRYSQILSHLSQELLVAETTDETIYNLTMEAIAATNPQRGAAIFIYKQIEGQIQMQVVGVWDNPSRPWPPLSLGAHYSAESLGLSPLLKTGQTIISIESTEDERFSEMLRQLLALVQLNSIVAVPIWVNREVDGFILAGHAANQSFTPETIRLYEEIARQTSGALEKLRLFEEAQYRANLLQISAEISQVATSSLELTTLLPQTVALIQDRFRFDYVSVYLVDEYQKYAIIEAATGKIGQQLLASKHRIKVGDKSAIGTAAKTGKPSLVLDLGQDNIHSVPLLPDTRSEMALPLIVRGKIIGVLAVQSKQLGVFNENETTILQSLADQLANAIEAARSFQASRQALEKLGKVQEYYLRNQWAHYLTEQQQATHYRLTEGGLFGATDTPPSEKLNQANPLKQPHVLPSTEQAAISTSKNNSGVPPKGQTLIAPLALDNAVLGVLDFEIAGAETGLDEDELEIVQAIAHEAAETIESVRQYEQTQAAREEAEALYQVGRALVTTEDEQEMLHTVLGSMLSILGLKQGGILFIEEEGKSGVLHALFENGHPVPPGLRFPIEGNPSYDKLIATKRPVVIEDIATDPLVATVREMNMQRGLVSLLLVPIIINDQVIGALGADSVGQKHIFTQREINLASSMADQLAIILQNRRLLVDANQRALQLQTSSEVSQVATSILDQEVMLSQAVDLIRDRFGFYHVQIFLVDEAKQFVELYKSSGEVGQKLLALKHKVAIGSPSVIGQVTHQRKSIVIGEHDLNSTTLYRRNQFLPETRSELAIPLQVGDFLIGVLDVQSTKNNAFTTEDISTLEILAAQLAIAIQNARAFAEQQQTAERLKEIDKLKTQFLANMSHELRTPLNSIIGFSRVILKGIDGPLTELQKTDLTSIHNSGQHLLSLINNILDLSKIEAGKMELNFEEVELIPIIKGVMSTALALVKDKPVALHQNIPDDLPHITADPTRIRQIILNLVSNACKFTDEGEVTINARADEHRVTISVTDTGIGIPSDKLESVFEEFTQVDASTTRKVGGTGLGLPISRHFVEMHNGEIWVESQLGYGSTLSFSIPIKPKVGKEEPLPETLILDKKDRVGKIVVAIDDDPGVITLYERFLEQHDYKVIGLNHADDLLSQVKALAPAVILLDVLMPNKDGWGVLRILKDDPLTKDIPIIVCSIISDKNKGFSLGAADYLVKPIVEQDLIHALKHLEQQNRGQTKVLVIDDQADDILLIRRILESQPNYRVMETNNGQEGLALVQSLEPDLIILDLSMPDMDGFRVVEALKGNEKTRTIPVIIVSAKELSAVEHHFLNGQVEVLLRKGIFTENELLEDVSQALKRIHQPEPSYWASQPGSKREFL